MPELRKDYLTNEWVSIAQNRSKRPMIFGDSGKCPFCPENRHMLPGIFYEDEYVKAIPNLYPILSDEQPEGFGFHEVIIDTPNHSEKFFELEPKRMAHVLACIRERVMFHLQDEKIKYVQVFKNSGTGAGASIAHSHWQLLAMPIIPSIVETMVANVLKYSSETNECYFCNLLKNMEELKVFENQKFIAFTPYASKFNYEICIMAKRRMDFVNFSNDDMLLLSDIMKKSLEALKMILNLFDYNILFYNGEPLHFHMKIIPRFGRVAGCEISSGLYINPVYPEEAAKAIRALNL